MANLAALFFALPQEAAPFVQRFKAKQVMAFGHIKLYQGEQAMLVVTGIGAINMATAVGWFMAIYQQQVAVVFNIGTAASTQLPLHQWQLVTSINCAVPRMHFYPDTILKKLPFATASLYSSDSPIAAPHPLFEQWQLIDMEGIAFAKAAMQFKQTSALQVLKWISDAGTLDFYKDKNWVHVYTANVETVVAYIETYTAAFNTISEQYSVNTDPLFTFIKSQLHLTFTEKHQLKQGLHYALLQQEEQIVQKKLESLLQAETTKQQKFTNILDYLFSV